MGAQPAHFGLAAFGGEQAFWHFTYRREEEIFGEDEEAEYFYNIISGAARTYKLLPDGRRQINAFHLPGDVFGLESGSIHRFTAEALVTTKVRLATRRGIVVGMSSKEEFAEALIALVTRNLQHAENHMLLLGRKTALEKVVAFLLEMDRRLESPNVITLPMNRRDIADYLGLTLETVSRALSALKEENVLQFEGPTQRKLVLLDRVGLARLDV